MYNDLENLDDDERKDYVTKNPESYKIYDTLTKTEEQIKINTICKNKPIWPGDAIPPAPAAPDAAAPAAAVNDDDIIKL